MEKKRLFDINQSQKSRGIIAGVFSKYLMYIECNNWWTDLIQNVCLFMLNKYTWSNQIGLTIKVKWIDMAIITRSYYWV